MSTDDNDHASAKTPHHLNRRDIPSAGMCSSAAATAD